LKLQNDGWLVATIEGMANGRDGQPINVRWCRPGPEPQ
jgi:hypothetical protein